MSMCVFVNAIKPANEYHINMCNLYEQCKALNIKIPKEVSDYFGGEEPNRLGVVISHYSLPTGCTQEFSDEIYTGVIVDLRLVPEHTRYLKFLVSF